MLSEVQSAVSQLLGLSADELTEGQMLVRALIVYVVALLMVRVGEKRFLGKNTAFDVILGIILGSVVSRAITSASGFFAILGAGFALVLLHWLFAAAAFRSDRFGDFVKGRHRVLVEDGDIRWDAMRKSQISRKDLMSALRSEANSDDLQKIKEARLERSGDISFVKANSTPKVLEVRVEDGVQTVRIELS